MGRGPGPRQDDRLGAGPRHQITCGIDQISQRPVVNDDTADTPTEGPRCARVATRNKDGKVAGRSPACCPGPQTRTGPALQLASSALVEGFALFNPHSTIRLDWFGTKTTWDATDPGWRKWKPHQPTSAHWYEVPRLERLVGAYITHDRDAGRTGWSADFLAEFDGLSGFAKRKAVLDEAGLHRMKLSELVTGDRLDGERIRAAGGHAAQYAAGPAGAAGHHRRGSPAVATAGDGRQAEVIPLREEAQATQKVKSRKSPRTKNASFPELPWVLESAFGWLGDEAEDERRIFAGANWSSAINNPFRTFGGTGEGLETVLAKLKATRSKPVVCCCTWLPAASDTDRGWSGPGDWGSK